MKTTFVQKQKGEPMRLIDADRLLDRCKFYHLPNGDLAVPIIDVQHAPTIEPERKKGEWIYSTNNESVCEEWTCNLCGIFSLENSNYCPSCGADMTGDENETD